MNRQLKIKEENTNKDIKISTATKFKKSGRANIDNLLKRIIVEKKVERKNSVIMMVATLSGIAIITILFSYS